MYLTGTGSSLLSLIFTEAQFQFLQNLGALDVTEDDFDPEAACQTNNTQQLRDTIQVCLTSTRTATTIDPVIDASSRWKIVMIAVAGGIVVLVLLVIAIRVYRRRRRTAKFITAELDDPQLVPLMLNPGDIKNVRKIGAGAHCVVWLVKYRKTQLLASKRLRKDLTRRRITKAFIEEIKLAAPLDHPSVVKLVGIAWTVKTDIQALYEYVDNGDVSDYLTRPGTLHEWTQQKLQIALEVAEALVYLHPFSPPILHRDLRAGNVLLTSDMKAKVNKVGVSHLRVVASGECSLHRRLHHSALHRCIDHCTTTEGCRHPRDHSRSCIRVVSWPPHATLEARCTSTTTLRETWTSFFLKLLRVTVPLGKWPLDTWVDLAMGWRILACIHWWPTGLYIFAIFAMNTSISPEIWILHGRLTFLITSCSQAPEWHDGQVSVTAKETCS